MNHLRYKLLIFLLPFTMFADLSVGPVIMYRDFRENLPSPLKSEEKGVLYGVGGNFGHQIDPFEVLLSGRYLEGKTRYRGTLQNYTTLETTPYASHSRNYLWSVEADLGVPIEGISPFLGFGYYEWSRLATDRATGYDELYRWKYVAIGANLSTHFKGIKTGLHIKAMRTMGAELEISDLFTFPVQLKLANCWKGEVRIPMEFAFTQQTNGKIEGFYRLEQIGKSQEKEVGGYWVKEPSSYSQNLGLFAKIAWVY